MAILAQLLSAQETRGRFLTLQKSGVVKTVVRGPAPLVNLIESASEVVILVRIGLYVPAQDLDCKTSNDVKRPEVEQEREVGLSD